MLPPAPPSVGGSQFGSPLDGATIQPPASIPQPAGSAVFHVASNVEPGVVIPLSVLVFTVVRPALRALVTPPVLVPTNVPPALTNACRACAGVPAVPTGVVAEIAE